MTIRGSLLCDRGTVMGYPPGIFNGERGRGGSAGLAITKCGSPSFVMMPAGAGEYS
jgi:hypothetical protein